MSTQHAFMDESRRKRYVVCVAVLPQHRLVDARKAMDHARKPGQSRIHMKSERDPRRRELLSVVCALGIEAHILERDKGGSEREARDQCLQSLLSDLPESVTRLTIESCDQDAQDRRVIAQSLGGRNLEYGHERPNSESLLWLPDIVAWAWGRGGDWRRRVDPVLANVQRLAA